MKRTLVNSFRLYGYGGLSVTGADGGKEIFTLVLCQNVLQHRFVFLQRLNKDLTRFCKRFVELWSPTSYTHIHDGSRTYP